MIIKTRNNITRILHLSVILLYFISSFFSLGGLLYWLPIILVCFSLLFLIVPHFKIENNEFFRWIFAFTCFSITSIVWAVNIEVASNIFKYLLPVYIFVIYVYIYSNDINDVKDILLVFYIAQLIVLIYIVSNVNLFTLSSDRLGGYQLGDNFNSNSIASNLCFAIYSGFFVLNNSKANFVKTVVYYLITAFMIFVILLTGSRGGITLLILPVLIYFLLLKGRHRFLNILLTIIACLLFLRIVIQNEWLYRIIGGKIESIFLLLQNKQEDSRIELLKLGIQWFQEKPILGYGINNFKELSNASDSFRGANFYAHNNYIELLVDVGIIGLLIYYSFYLAILKKCLKTSSFRKFVFPLILSLMIYELAEVTYYGVTFQFFLCIFSILLFKKQISCKFNHFNP